ncbi:RNA polymerase sigma factor [Mucilaginibacter sp. FT3.2]|uniref:RNA polymerase sigma factor n=1 Tax=Mucilaginibacter sp. FT3.2 TaxID=2723090 RepID=UPI00160D7342|nr:RNA polymerase sigma-70 factor [Mucilaginibacter sp. FT3.2]MBB6233618.1 RNA polymerase sigma-70 factor (ECF subfamily) [Mucilaginibacter sp. FT3.2]
MRKHANPSTYSNATDHELLVCIKEGSKGAFEVIYDRYWAGMYIHAYNMLKEEDEAKDVVQELFTHLWSHCNELELRLSLKGYLYTSLRNRILNIFDKSRVRKKYTNSLVTYFEEGHSVVEEQFREKELRYIIDQEVANLPEKMRQVFLLRRNEHLSHKEIAEELQISDKTVKKQINNAIKLLKLKISYLFILLVFIS